MHEINKDKVMTVCMTMIRIYIVNVTASNQKRELQLIPVSLQGTP